MQLAPVAAPHGHLSTVCLIIYLPSKRLLIAAYRGVGFLRNWESKKVHGNMESRKVVCVRKLTKKARHGELNKWGVVVIGATGMFIEAERVEE